MGEEMFFLRRPYVFRPEKLMIEILLALAVTGVFSSCKATFQKLRGIYAKSWFT